MYKKITLIILLLFTLLPYKLWAQTRDRTQIIQQRLDAIAVDVPGLDQKVQLMVTGISIVDYLNALAKSNKLSISIDPKLSFTVYDTFNGVTATNILVLLAQKYNLDISTVGSIIYIMPFQDPAQFIKSPVKEINASYNAQDNTLSLTLTNDSLPAVARKITRLSGKNIIVPNGLQNKQVSAFIQNAPFETALEKLAYGNELKMIKTSDNFFLFQPLEENEELYVNGDKNTAVRKTFKAATPGGHGSAGILTRMINGQNLISADATNTPIADLVKQASQELNKNYSLYSELKGSITIHVNDVSYDDFLSLLLKGTDYTFHVDNDVYLIGDSKLAGLRTFKAIQLQYRSIDTVVAMIPSEWKKNVEIKEFKEQNTLLLSGSGANIAEMTAFIKQLDVLVPSVMIEVTMIDINKSRTVSTGLAAGVSDSVKTGGSILPGMNFTFSTSSVNNLLNGIGKVAGMNLGHVVPNFYVSLNALESVGDVDVRSVPKLTALNGHTATISIGSSLYYKNSTQSFIPTNASSSSTVLTNAYIESDANMKISIKPVISGDDQITMGIKIDISDFTSIPTDGSPPPKSTSSYETSMRINNEDMILLGGIERTEKDDTVSGFPILSRIPILKYIFSNKSKALKKVVTVVFIRPIILR
ncbi:secretin and TonB N-terminal domain-containing protein [Mucilaginibacter sp.]